MRETIDPSDLAESTREGHSKMEVVRRGSACTNIGGQNTGSESLRVIINRDAWIHSPLLYVHNLASLQLRV